MPVKRRRGRPVKIARDLGLDEVAEALGFAPDALARLLSRAPGTLPGAECQDGVWTIPERALAAFIGSRVLEPLVSVKDVAEALSISEQAVYGWLRLVGPNGVRLLPHRKILGHVRILARDVAKLPSEWPAWAPARPVSFFSEEVEVS